jgi:Pro-kumamolisin, activation domain/Bacterial Ig-like domain (group 3)
MDTNMRLWLNVKRTIGFVSMGAGFALTLAAWALPAAAQTTESAASTQTPSRPARITRAIDDKQLVRLKGNVHPLAQARFDQGAMNDAQPIGRMLLLLQRSPDQESDLRQLLEDQLTNNSPKHHGWLTPEQFGAQFGPVDADIQATTDWLNSMGFHGIKVGPGRTVIEFSGNAGQVRAAFHTEMHRYLVEGALRFANSSDPSIPAALAPVVAGVVSLHSFPKFAHSRTMGNFRRSAETGVIEPTFSFAGCGSGGTSQCNGLGPADLAKIYNVPPSLDGTGQTIAVVGQSNINIEDVQEYRAMFGLPTNDPQIILNGPDPGPMSDETEADLDVQVSGGLAPKAKVKFVVSETPDTAVTAGIDLSALYIIDNNIAAVLSESYGACESSLLSVGNAFYNALWEQAAAQGITVLVSSGDNGSAACDDPNSSDFATGGLAVSGLASTPFNISVGGTDFSYSVASPASVYWNATNGGTPAVESAKSYIPESTWNDSCALAGLTGCTSSIITSHASSHVDLVAASGGPSSIYTTKPAWQTGITGMPNDNRRDTPDISLFASNGKNQSFYIVCQKDVTGSSCDLNAPFQDFDGVGGTSASVQAVAGIMALINQSQATVSNPAPRQGNANYILYKLYKQQSVGSGICTSNPAAASASGCIFYDVTAGNISVACQGGSLNCSNTSTAANQFGVISSGGAPAWKTTAGYDLATGLGTVNVANLANAWGGVGLTATTTAITASPSGTLTHGASASFTVHVTASAGTPAGQVSLIATPAGAEQTGIGPFALSSGTAAISTKMLPGGTTFKVVAHYSGDGTFAQSDSAPVLVTVSKESSQTFVGLVTFDPNTGNISSSNASTAVYGSPYIMRIDVTDATSIPCSDNSNAGTIPPIDTIPCPTGNVTLTDNGAPFNDFLNTNTGVTSNVAPLNRHGNLEDQPIQLTGGSHSIMAAYAGDNSYTASMSTPDAVTITLATTAATLAAPANATTVTPVTITATISTISNGGAPTGTVQFLNVPHNGVPVSLGTPAIAGAAADQNAGTPATGTASVTVTLPLGQNSITAIYNGDTNYAVSGATAAKIINVTAGTTGTFVVTGTAVTVTAGGSATSTITVTPSGGFTGDVQITCAGMGLPPGLTCTPNPLTISVTGANPVTGVLTVTVAAPSSMLTASRLPVAWPLYASAMIPSANRTNGGNEKGWWIFSAGTGFGAVLLFFLPALGGRKRLRASFGLGLACVLSLALGCGGGGGGGGGGTMKAATHTSISVPASKLPSTSNDFAFTVTVTSTGAAPVGQVQLFDGTTALGLPVSVSNGTVLVSIGLPGIGTHSVTAHYLGDAGTAASNSGALSLTVTGVTTLPLTTTPSGSGNVNLTIQ